MQHEKLKAKLKMVDERRLYLERQTETLQQQVKVNEERFEKEIAALQQESSVEMAANVDVKL